ARGAQRRAGGTDVAERGGDAGADRQDQRAGVRGRRRVRVLAQLTGPPTGPAEGKRMGRKILLITTDQMRYDALGCNGGRVARTPAIDALAAGGINYRRAHNQSVVCMPARATIVTGQHVATHGVWMNG